MISIDGPGVASHDGARVLVVPNEYPLPANTGGRIDVWRRAKVLRSLGCSLALLTWYDLPRFGEPDSASRQALAQVFQRASLYPVTRSPAEVARRLVWLPRWPSHAASRWVTIHRMQVLQWARDFAPDVILLDGLYGSPVAFWLARQLGVRLVYRSHNIESAYMKRQLATATGWRSRLGLLANLVGLERLENSTLQRANSVLDISQEDLLHWQRQGHKHLEWLPPVVDEGFVQQLVRPEGEPLGCDVLYFGNLNTPNNVQAVRWLVDEVLPRVGKREISVVLAGSRPSRELMAIAACDPRVRVVADPADMARVVRTARILVNPVLAGSGVNLKSVEMMFSDAALISTSVGVQGMPATAKACFKVCDTPEAFAQAILDAVNGYDIALTERQQARQPFGVDAAARMLREHVISGAMRERHQGSIR